MSTSLRVVCRAIVYLRTLKLGLIVTGISVLMSYPAAFVLARMPARRRSFLMLLVILPVNDQCGCADISPG